MKVKSTSVVMGGNLVVIQNTTIKESLLKKKHAAISHHQVREVTTAGVTFPAKISSHDNYGDALTKSLESKEFNRFTGARTLFCG